MKTRLELDILPQPDNVTCGPTCLHAVYRYFADDLPLGQVIVESPRLEEGGSLAVQLGCHALARGYEARISTSNLQVFDPTWFAPGAPPLEGGLRAQMEAKESPKLHAATESYLEFLKLGGQIRMDDLTPALIRQSLDRSTPILTGLSATYLYRSAREYGPNCDADDIRGYPVGHFVVLCGYDRETKTVDVADPFLPNPLGPKHHYSVDIGRVIRAILLGVLTYDANLLMIQPRKERRNVSCPS